MGATRAHNHRLGQAALLSVPVIALGCQFGDGMLLKKLAGSPALVSLPGDRLGSVLAELGEGAVLVRVGPGATRAIDTAFLIEHGQCFGAADQAGLAPDFLHRLDDGRETGGDRLGGGEFQPGEFFRGDAINQRGFVRHAQSLLDSGGESRQAP